ncbi:hypothetical protein EON82_11030 [bacterium]|nr:MAG: hypothetical protein EON82_11030 [bacterium]
MRALGTIWLALDAVILLILLQPALQNPAALSGPAAPEYLVPPLLICAAVAVPGLLFLFLGLKKHRSDNPN